MEKKLKWFITGDIHGQFERLSWLKDYEAESVALIVLGDLGANYYLDKKENSQKLKINGHKNFIYAIRGNHEERPENVPGITSIYDENVKGDVWCDKIRYPYIRYLKDGGKYEIDGHSILVIGGAYSVDKWYRLAVRAAWFKEEQLSESEMDSIYKDINCKKFDIILSHTCPFSWEPRDLFLSSVDQSTVDDSMEKWMDKVKDSVVYNVWLFGHFHDDRIVRPHVEMFFKDVSPLVEVWNRWNNGDIPPYWNYDPNYFAKDNRWADSSNI